MTKLKPCPFCDKRGMPILILTKIATYSEDGMKLSGLATWGISVKCCMCGIQTIEDQYVVESDKSDDFIIKNYADRVINKWNTRKGEEE